MSYIYKVTRSVMTPTGCKPLVHSSQVLVSSKKPYSSTLDFAEHHRNVLLSLKLHHWAAQRLLGGVCSVTASALTSVTADFCTNPLTIAPHRKTKLLRSRLDLGGLILTGAGGCWELSHPQPLGAGDEHGCWGFSLGQGDCEMLSCKKTPWLLCVVSRWDWFT